MKIKEGKIRSSSLFKKILNFICKIIFNKKTKTLFFFIILIVFLLTGIFAGLIVSGFFGTFDEPSQKALDIIHSAGIYGLGNFKLKIEGIKQENIKIPFNYIKGQFSNPKKIFIDINFKDFQKIEYKRQQALGSLTFESWLFKPFMGILATSAKDYVPARIRYKNKEVRADIRLKGDLTDHLNTDKWSFRIKIKGNDTLFGMKVFSIQYPESRGYLNELVYHYALKKENVLFLRYDFIEVVINGENKGIYALEEHFDKRLIENNNRRGGVIIKFNENLMWEEILSEADSLSNFTDYFDYMEKNFLNSFQKSYIETFNNKRVLADPVLSRQFESARSLLESFRSGSLKTSEVFDVDKLAKYFAVNTLVGSSHPSCWNNIRFYYNPITSRLEPIGFDAEAPDTTQIPKEYCYDWGNCSKKGLFIDLVFEDKIFFDKYIQELERISKEAYLDNLFLELDDEIEQYTNILHKDYPSYRFSKEVFYQNQEQIRAKLRLNSTKIIDEVETLRIETNKNQPKLLKSSISYNLKLILIASLLLLNLLLLILLLLLIKSKKSSYLRRHR